ncbi:MAG: TonB-dependent receptor [Pyrinomonadaceae bacterium]
MKNLQLRTLLVLLVCAITFGTTSISARAALEPQVIGSIAGIVTDQNGAAVAGAEIALLTGQHLTIAHTQTGVDGRFSFTSLADGQYEIRVHHAGFAVQSRAVSLTNGPVADLAIELDVAPVSGRVTVSAETGQANDINNVAQAINVIPEEAIRQRTTGVLAQVADEEVGVSLQRTSPTIGAIFIRGLTGKNVSVYVDGVRYSTYAMRGGINTFFNLNEPTGLREVELLRGPNSAQYGSDSLGGTISLISRAPVYGSERPDIHGELNTGYTSADNSFGGNLLLNRGTRNWGAYLNVAARRVNRLRSANGLDGHAAVTRFLGLPSDVLGTHLPDTAFTQYGGTFHANYNTSENSQLVFHYLRSQQDGGKRYDQLMGGDGNLVSDLRNLMLDFGYLRYVRQGFGFFDHASFAGSFNSQREERVNQGGQGNPVGTITHQYERTSAFGFNFFLDKQIERHTFLIGGDVYRETVKAPAYTFNPVNGLSVLSRPRVPNGARYIAAGIYAQDGWQAIPNKLRIGGALRYNVASYQARSTDSPLVGGAPLWPNDSLRVDDFSGRVGFVWTPGYGVGISMNYARGFRSPSITDLGTLGLTGDGFEVDYSTAIGLGGTIGTTADAMAITTGLPVAQLESEVSNNFDAGVRITRRRWNASLTGFRIDLDHTLVKQALILPPGAVGRSLGGQPIISQSANGVVFVALSTAPVLVRANYTDAVITGMEATLDARINPQWSLGGNFTYLRAEDKANGRAPNIEGGTPPAQGFFRVRYDSPRGRWWVEGYTNLADRQNRLSTLDLSDRRTGGTRTRAQIANFFNRGARVLGLIGPGPDGIPGNADDRLLATNETVLQVQNRLLGTANSAPLFRYLPGYGLLNVRFGIQLGERSELGIDAENLNDKSYRGPSWGIDGPGRSLTVRYRYRF